MVWGLCEADVVASGQRVLRRVQHWVAREFGQVLLLLAFIFVVALFHSDIAAKVQTMEAGNLAEWMTGITTGTVAYLAYRTSREATRTTRTALEVQLRQSASALTWTLTDLKSGEGQEFYHGDMERMAYGIGHPFQDVPEEVRASVGIRIRNIGTNTLSDIKVKFSDDVAAIGDSGYGLLEDAGEVRQIPPLRPGEDVLYKFHGRHDPANESNISWSMDIFHNRFVDWVEYSDHGRRWRRDRAGVLTEVEPAQ